MKYHVVITGSRAPKNSRGHYVDLPEANVEFIERTLAMLPKSDYVYLYNGQAKGVDMVADDYAFANGIRTKQFPAYWFDPTKEKNYDARAGLFRNEQMIRAAMDAVYNKTDEEVIVLAFYATENLSDSRGTAHAVEFAKKKGLNIRTFQLPVLNEPAPKGSNAPFEQPTQ